MRVPDRKLLALIDTIYRAALDPGAWQEAVDGLHALFPPTSVHLQGYQAGERAILLTVEAGSDPSAIADYRANWVAQNPYPALIPQMAIGVPVIAEESRFIDTVRRTEFYKDYCSSTIWARL